jgi:hypothetical protein
MQGLCYINVGQDPKLTSLSHGHLDYKRRSTIIVGFLPRVARGDAVFPICLNTKLPTEEKWTNRHRNGYGLKEVSKMSLVKGSDVVNQRLGN